MVVGAATGCLEVSTTIYPYTSWKGGFIHTAFENAAATVSGQTLTAVKSGVLEIHYSPVFKVVVLDLVQEVAEPNLMQISCTLEEVLTV